MRSSTRVETSAEITLREQLAGEQESTATLVELVDELKRKTKESEREFEEFRKRQQEEYNRLCEQVIRLSFPGK
jgi:predicted HicB family RNase H-like nuclease